MASAPATVTRARPESPPVGLCVDCISSRRVVSVRGSEFWLCVRSEKDPRFPKYPRLPVLECPGYERREKRGTSSL